MNMNLNEETDFKYEIEEPLNNHTLSVSTYPVIR